MTQYGFYIDSSRCTGAKLANWLARISKTYQLMSVSGAFTNMPEVTGSRIMVHGIRMCLLTICLSPATIVVIPPVPKCARVARCISAMMVLWW